MWNLGEQIVQRIRQGSSRQGDTHSGVLPPTLIPLRRHSLVLDLRLPTPIFSLLRSFLRPRQAPQSSALEKSRCGATRASPSGRAPPLHRILDDLLLTDVVLLVLKKLLVETHAASHRCASCQRHADGDLALITSTSYPPPSLPSSLPPLPRRPRARCRL